MVVIVFIQLSTTYVEPNKLGYISIVKLGYRPKMGV